MCGVLYFCFIIIIAIRFSSTSSPEKSGLCGIPSSPFGAVPLQKTIYNEGDEVEFKCENDYIDLKQTKKCVKGRWVKVEPGGREPFCGPEDESKKDIIGGSSTYVLYKESMKSIPQSEILVSDDHNIGNYVLVHSKRNFLASAKGFEVTFRMASAHIIYLLRMAFSIDNEDSGNDIYLSLDVGNHRKCDLINKRNYIPSKWSKVMPEGHPHRSWFICKAFDEDNFNTGSNVIVATITSKVEIYVNWIDFYFVGEYTIDKKPNCGFPDHPIGFEIKPNKQDQTGFTLSCAEGFSQDNQNENNQDINCDYKMEWSEVSFECIPKSYCEQLEQKIGLKNLKGVVSMKKGYYSPSKYFAIFGTKALITCVNKTISQTYNKTIICDANGEWNGFCSEDKNEETTVTTNATTIQTTEIEYTIIPSKRSPSSSDSDYSTSTMSPSDSTSFTQTIKQITTKNGIKCQYKGKYLGVENWPEVNAGENSSVLCPQGEGHAVWKCMNNGKFNESGPDWSDCYKWLDDLPPQIENYESVLDELDTISDNTVEDNSIIDYDRSAQVMKRLETYQNFTKSVHNNDFKKAKKYASKTINILSNLLNQKFMWSNTTAVQKAELGSILLKRLQYVTFDLGSKQTNFSGTGRIKSEHIYSKTFFTDQKKELIFPADFDEKNVSIIIPEGLTPKNTNLSETNTSAGAVIYKLSEYLGGTDEYKEVFSPILSFSLTYEIGIVELNKPIKIKFKHKRRQIFGEEIDCVYWDFNTSFWSTEGCYKVYNESDFFTTVCKCNHLCNLAALMDTSGREDNKDRIISKLTDIFCGISIVCLIFSIISSFRWSEINRRFSKKAKEKALSSLIIRNLSISVLTVNLIVFSSISIIKSEGLCKLFFGLLLYSLLSSFCWMLLVGYRMIYKIWRHYDNEYFDNKYIFYGYGYGVPIILLLPGLTTAYFTEQVFIDALSDTRYNNFYWISPIKYPYCFWLLIGPFLAVMVVNACFIIFLLRIVLCSGNHFDYRIGQELKNKDTRLFTYIMLFNIFGVTWLSFILYVNKVFHFASYLFIVLNGLQGLYIFSYNYFLNIGYYIIYRY